MAAHTRPSVKQPLIVLGLTLAANVFAADQPYPVRPLRIVTGFPPGGNTDIIARAMAQKLTERLGQQVIVENRPGAGSMIGTDYVAKATPDGSLQSLAGPNVR